MPRGTQLGALQIQLRDELSLSHDPNVGVDDLAGLQRTLRRVQQNLFDEYDWPHLRQRVSLSMAAGQRYYDIPSVFTYERIEEVKCRFDALALDVERGIDFSDYDVFDPENDDRNDPVRKWDIVWTGAKEQIEVWPIPATTTTLRVQGIRQLRALTAATDVCDLDDRLIVLFSAAELLARAKAADAQAKLQQAQQLLARMKARTTGASKPVSFGGSSPRSFLAGATISVSSGSSQAGLLLEDGTPLLTE